MDEIWVPDAKNGCVDGADHLLYVHNKRVIAWNHKLSPRKFKVRVDRFIVVRCADCRACWLPELPQVSG